MADVGSPVSVERATGERRLDVLDGLRCAAILMVAAFHYTVRWAPPLDASPAFPTGHLPAGRAFAGIAPLAYGWIGVELFFFISGFVILMTLERCTGLVDFAIRRFARLWPPMLVAATATGLIVYAAGPVDWRQGPSSWLSSLLFLPPDLVGRMMHARGLAWIDGVYWTLWVEVRFYILAAALFLLPRRAFAPALLAVELLAVALMHAPSAVLRGVAETLLFAPYMPYFVFGMGGYLVFSGRASRLVTAVMAISGALVLGHAAFDPPLPGTSAAGTVVANLVVTALFLGFVLRSRVMAAFAWRPFVLAGRASYSFYLLHQKLGVMLLIALTGLGLPLLVAAPLTLVAFVLLSLALFATVEEPVKRWVHARTRGAVGLITDQARWAAYRHPQCALTRGNSKATV